ncbi:hypothetical protein [Alcanivorax sp.]|uniref:hypothetical protein n=1 Tax=Alcanivorax sp. TaxID=1872427 RepID=UPI0025BAFB38|nr:hypothetical protein [Alcanivorax sp.]
MFENIKFQFETFDWGGVSGVSDLLMVILTIVLLIGLRQGSHNIREASLSRDADILRWAMSEMDTLKPLIRIITDAHQNQPYNKKSANEHWKKEEREAAQQVSVKLQRIGYMAWNNLISRNHFMNIWGPMYLCCWYALEPWVLEKRHQLDEPERIEDGAFSRHFFEIYALYCEAWLPLGLVNNERSRFGLTKIDSIEQHRKRNRKALKQKTGGYYGWK